MELIDQYIEDNRDAFQQDLFELLKIPSVSTDSRHKNDMELAAAWVADQFRAIQFQTEIVPTPGHPIVYAQSPKIDGAPTVLVYGHYDVQPPDPLDEWLSPPFEPTVRDGSVYARGATDDKGQMLTHIKSAQAWINAGKTLPIQIKYLIEGEEEVGSSNLDGFLNENLDRLGCDIAVISDTSQFGPGKPAITYGLKGIVYFEVFLRGPRQDLHSGTFGGSVANPANAMAKIMGSLVDENGRVTLDGFYDDVLDLTVEEREQFASLDFDEQRFREQIGVSETFGEQGFTTLERRWARPTCDVNGIYSGYQGEGAKTVLPCFAGGKVSCRLVPNQDPDKVRDAMKKHLQANCPPGLDLEVICHHGAPGIVVPLDSPYVSAAASAIEHGFGVAPVFIREGGSIPVVTAFKELLGVDTLLLGWGLDDDNTHSPNEKFSLGDFHRGIKASAHLWNEIGNI